MRGRNLSATSFQDLTNFRKQGFINFLPIKNFYFTKQSQLS